MARAHRESLDVPILGTAESGPGIWQGRDPDWRAAAALAHMHSGRHNTVPINTISRTPVRAEIAALAPESPGAACPVPMPG